MAADEPYTLSSEHLGALPVINFFLARMGVAEHLATYLPADDARLRLTPAAVIALVVRNIVAGHRPVYALGEWATPYDPAVLGLRPGDAEALNDDRVGRMLDRLFDADRASLITATVLGVIRDFGVDVSQLHNDSTTVTVTGKYPAADGRARGGTATQAIRHGHNKDYRPDLKQLLFIRTVSADGAVPIAYRVADGNTNDDVTHIPTWDELHALVGRADFLYVADSKLCSAQAMGHINSHGGRFVTVVPHGRREDTWFRDWAQTHAPAWAEAHRRPGSRLEDPDRVWRTFEAPAPSVDGYRVIWVHSSMKAANDAQTRAGRIEAGLAAVDAVAARLAGPKTRLKTKVAAEAAATTALTAAGATRWVGFHHHRNHRRHLPPGTPRPPRQPDPLPAQRETRPHHHRRHPSRQRGLRRRHRRLLPGHHQRHHDDPRRRARRLPLPTQPRTPQSPPQRATRSRPRLPRNGAPH